MHFCIGRCKDSRRIDGGSVWRLHDLPCPVPPPPAPLSGGTTAVTPGAPAITALKAWAADHKKSSTVVPTSPSDRPRHC